jgi:hypothetical protein
LFLNFGKRLSGIFAAPSGRDIVPPLERRRAKAENRSSLRRENSKGFLEMKWQ